MVGIWLGVDDTDSPRGGCTTWVLTELLDEARSHGIDLIGEPRLVRLNPNVPWKTRGNAALSARFAVGRGPRRRLGEVDGHPVWSFANGRPIARGPAERFVEGAWRRVLRASRRGEPGTDPALVAADRRLPASLYWRAVREVVDAHEVRELLEDRAATVRIDGSDRGVVGAAAALAWPGAHATWEVIAYRPPERWGTPREVDPESVRAAQERFPDLFLCFDPRTRRMLVAPHTPCPILYGLRGTRPAAPLAARRRIVSETVDRWVLFRTNQGSGDHLVPRSIAELSAYGSAYLAGRVVSDPTVRAGGHVAFSLADDEGATITCRAFEPTKTLPRVARALRPGDRVRVWGSRGLGPDFRLEGIAVLRLSQRWTLGRPPRCSRCGRATRSLGTSRGFRCPECRRRWPPEAAVRTPAPVPLRRGAYHPTPSARRHLALLGPEGGRPARREGF